MKIPTLPFFSLIIPTYNRPQQLTACLQSLARLDFPCNRFEVIVVDDGSDLPLDAIVASFKGRFDLTLLHQNNAGPAAARNTGAVQAKGDYLVFTDDDCEPASDWLRKLTVGFWENPDCLIGGRTINALPDNSYAAASQLLIDYLYSYYNTTAAQPGFFCSNNFALPAMLFNKLGGFDTSFPRAAAEDREFCDRLRMRGYKMIYAPEAVIYHAHAMTLRNFLRQHFHYGCGAYHFRRARAQRNRAPLKVEPWSFYWNLLRYPFVHAPGRALSIALLLCVSQATNVAGFFRETLKQWRAGSLFHLSINENPTR